jgi:hypothetical protein
MTDVHVFVVEQGANWTATIACKNEDGTIRNLTGASVRMDVRIHPESTQTLVELSTTNGRIAVDLPNGIITLQLTAVETALLDVPYTNRLVYDILLTLSGNIEKILKGTIVSNESVTR